ncbi:MAG: ABC transporter permease subunit [Rhodothermaceae bacterium]
MNKIKRILPILIVILFVYIYYQFITIDKNDILMSPSVTNWFGTDSEGNDILIVIIESLFYELLTVIICLPIIYFLSIFIGHLLSKSKKQIINDLIQNILHFWITLPIILIALFLLIIIGSSQLNAISVIIFIFIPSQSLYIYNQIFDAKKEPFVLAKLSYGFSQNHIFWKHIFPFIRSSSINYSLSRIPEIIMLNISLNFMGLATQPPHHSFGRVLFDGLSFMFSAWWIWLFPVLFISLLYLLLINKIKYWTKDV